MNARALIGSLVALSLIGAILFGSAGRVDIPEFWVYVAALAGVTVIELLVIDPDLVQERMRPGGKPLPAGYWLLGLLPVAHWVMAGLDRGRVYWSDTVPLRMRLIGLVVLVLAQVVILWAMHVNRFFSSVVRIQTERGHHVITTGPYRWVRHPGYAAALLMILASGLGLGSWLATLIALAGVPLLMVRTRNEEAVLQRDLPGYADYAQQVRFRLVPLIW
jgi:protein-S-isoprenylcysteine O-methyltransferase Ste14